MAPPASDRGWERDPETWRGPRYDAIGWWPILLVGLGVLFLLQNFGVLGGEVWGQIWQLWPLVLVAIGVSMLIRPGNRSLPSTGIWALLALGAFVLLFSNTIFGLGLLFAWVVPLGILALVLWLFFTGGSGRGGKVLRRDFDIPLGEARAGDVQIDFGAGEIVVDATNQPAFAAGSLDYYESWGEPVIEASQGPTTHLRLSQRGYRGFGSGGVFNPNQHVRWHVSLNRGVPLVLHAKFGASKTTLNLEHLNVTDLHLDTGASDTMVVFPAGSTHTRAVVKGGAASFKLLVPRNVATSIKTSTGLASVTIDPNIRRLSEGEPPPPNTLELEVEVGVASVEIRAL
jgi:hypothetical protein